MTEPQQLDWVALAGDPPHHRRISFEHVEVGPATPADPLRPQITITRTEGRVTEIDIAPPADYSLAFFMTAQGSLHIAFRAKSR